MSGDSHHHHIASAETSELLSSSRSSTSSGDEEEEEERVGGSKSCVSISDAVVRYKTRHAIGSTLHLGDDDHAAFDYDAFPRRSAPETTFSRCAMLFRPGPRYILFTEGDVQTFRCNSRATVTKLLKAQCMRQWESTRLILGSFNIIIIWLGYVEQRIPYCAIGEIEALPHWDAANHKFCIRIIMSDTLLLIQTNTIRERDQLLHSIRWKTCVSKFWREFQQTTRRRRSQLVNDFKEMVDSAISSPILDDSILEFPLEVLSSVLDDTETFVDRQCVEEMFVTITALLEISAPSKPMFDFFTKYSRRFDVAHLVLSAFHPVVYTILKHNLEIGRPAKRRMFVQEYIEVMRNQKNGRQSVLTFIKRVHGSGNLCPHQRILPNLVSVCLPVIHGFYETPKQPRNRRIANDRLKEEGDAVLEEKLMTYLAIMQIMCAFADWLPQMARLLQPVPFPIAALEDDLFLAHFSSILLSISDHEACEVHCTVLGVREDRDGWFDHFCPHSGLACRDDGHVYGVMLRRLIGCCCLRRQFVERKAKMLDVWRSMAETGDQSAIELLVAVLDYKIAADAGHSNRQVVDSLQATEAGQKAYWDFCQRQFRLLEIQRKSGPRQLTLPSKATDADLSKILNSGSFGNLVCLTLAFTNVTSACAHDIIKLPFLQKLNLWSTQFSDVGVELLSEHMGQLEVLNLCETPVTDKGLRCLTALKSLRKLNLNSTQVSALTFEKLKESLPLLKEYDVSYTDAW